MHKSGELYTKQLFANFFGTKHIQRDYYRRLTLTWEVKISTDPDPRNTFWKLFLEIDARNFFYHYGTVLFHTIYPLQKHDYHNIGTSELCLVYETNAYKYAKFMLNYKRFQANVYFYSTNLFF